MANPKVMVYCFAYNQEKYIRQTLDGFINQITDFDFQVIVHDDASKDRTPDIIREYASKYPQIIKPILQKKNQFSIDGGITLEKNIEPLITSKYVAVCEGDDYWTDPHKLQMQYDYMEAHDECAFCVHNTEIIDEKGNSLNRLINNSEDHDRDYTTEDIIASGGGGLFHTSSHFWRGEYGITVPKEYQISGVSDYPKAIYLATKGTVHYISKVMSAYRQNSVGSWSRENLSDSKKVKEHFIGVIRLLKKIDRSTDFVYHDAINTAIIGCRYILAEWNRDYLKILRNRNFRKILKKKNFQYKVLFAVKLCMEPILKGIAKKHER